jgi:beta-1,4-mannosyltransferase
MRIRFWPDWSAGNPYQRLFYDALRKHSCEASAEIDFRDHWLLDNCSHFDAIHIHWPEALWRTRSWWNTARRQIGIWKFFRLARKLGIRLIWTVHNHGAHEGGELLDKFGYRLIASAADLVIVHSQSSAAWVRHSLRPSNLVVMPIGAYHGVYPIPQARNKVVAALGLNPAGCIVACLGAIRAYKGVHFAIECAKRLGPSTQFVIAGNPHCQSYAHEIRRVAAGLSNVHLIAEYVSDQQFADITAASDVAFLPYTKITGSSALLAAWTLGRGVVASDLEFFREMVADVGVAAVLYRNGDTSAACDAIRRYLQVPAAERESAALRAADRYRWDRCITPVVNAISNWNTLNS